MSIEPYQPEPETHEEQMEVLREMVRVRDSTISAQGARIAELEELLSQARGDLSCYPGTRGIISDINELLGDES